MSEKTFILGERRSVTLQIAVGESPVLPEDPVWELVEIDTGQTEATGPCELTHDEENGIYQLSALVEPKSRGLYRLYFQFTIGTEIRKPYMVIKVI